MQIEPWPHLVIDDYYPQVLYENMITELKRFVNEKLNQGGVVRKQTVFRNITKEFDLPATKK